jgi:large conductance mechanosensitive channel
MPLNGQYDASLADARKAGAALLNGGPFVNAIIQFLIVSFAVFWIVKALAPIDVRREDTPAPATSEIRDLLKNRAALESHRSKTGQGVPGP